MIGPTFFAGLRPRRAREESRRLGVYPRLNGQYQALMLEAFDTKATVVEVRDLSDALARARNGTLSGLWINFDDKFVVPRRRERQMMAARKTVRTLSRLKKLGVPLMLTLHNEKPHDGCDPKAFGHLRGFLLQNADLVHGHSSAAAALAQRSGTPEARIGVVPHPSYLGHVPGATARTAGPEAPRFLSFGATRRYKGHDLMIEAFATMREAPRVAHLTVAGNAREEGGLDFARLSGRVTLDRDARVIPEAELPALFGAHDWAVLAYRSSLTSGAAMLALSFGLPVVAPDLGGMREVLTGPLADFLFAPGDAGAMAEALDRATRVTPDDWLTLHGAALARAEALRPAVVSQDFKALLARHAMLPAPLARAIQPRKDLTHGSIHAPQELQGPHGQDLAQAVRRVQHARLQDLSLESR
ncbi:glycosyltransferase [Sagittula salina]|uniref:Glycosyltransferase n=1 Tax=Sagittula salina TaxID=2820268 RepID=A0A940S2A9_9RHOB|nr:glycosyltransferase [Sagittula salina]MBP0481460.1 glycosyltransferase [Sagittula salina]